MHSAARTSPCTCAALTFTIAAGIDVACPYFVPVKKWDGGGWMHPSRLPLGAGWMGLCGAAPELVQPTDDDVREACNMGYAFGCARLPKNRPADAVRFAVIKDSGGTVTLCFVCESGHRPARCGTLEWDLSERTWVAPNGDTRIRKMAECYLETYVATKRRATSSF